MPYWASIFSVMMCSAAGTKTTLSVVELHSHSHTWLHTAVYTYIPTNNPAFCLIIKQKYCLDASQISTERGIWRYPGGIAHTFWMDTQHFQAKILQIEQIWHISQAEVYLQVDGYVLMTALCHTATYRVQGTSGEFDSIPQSISFAPN